MQHLDEGTIHAWLDGQLPRDEAQSIEAHVAECRECAGSVAEARGLIAASTRILTALDSVPREVAPKTTPARAAGETASSAIAANAPVASSRAEQRAHRRWFNGASLAAAAAIVVAIGTVTLMRADKRGLPRLADRVAPTSTVAGPAVLDSQVPIAAPAPAAASEAVTLGAREAADGKRPLAATRSDAPATRDQAAAASQGFASGKATERSEEAKALEARQLADARPNAAPPVDRAKVARQVAANELQKPADELNKDAKKELDRADAVASLKQNAVGTIRGRVTDANNTGLAGVMVRVQGTGTGVSTNEAGDFVLGGLNAGSHRLNAMRVGFAVANRDVTVAGGDTLTANIVMTPATVALEQVVVTGAAASRQRAPQGAQRAPAPVAQSPQAAPAAALPTAAQSTAAGCYELSIIPGQTPSRTGFRQVPRRVALDSTIVPASPDGVWYRARDLAPTTTVPNGRWRPAGPDAVEVEWTYGSRTARVRVSGPAGSMLRGSVEEIDRATATGEAGTVVAIRRSCEG